MRNYIFELISISVSKCKHNMQYILRQQLSKLSVVSTLSRVLFASFGFGLEFNYWLLGVKDKLKVKIKI